MRRIRIAQIGTSRFSHGSDIFHTMSRHPELFELAGYALPENEREKFPERMGVFEGYREMTVEEILSDPTIEAVTVETEEIYLTKYAQLVADAGKHMHMEKPGGRDLAAFEKLIETVKRNGTVFHPGYMYRYNPYVLQLLEDKRNGMLGDILTVEAEMNCIHEKDCRDWLNIFPGGMMFFLGCHLVDLVMQLQGIPERVIPLNRCTGKDGTLGKDLGMAVLEYPKGVSFVRTCDSDYGGFMRRELVVTGTKKTVEIRPLEIARPDTIPYGQTTRRTEYADRNWSDGGQVSETEVFGRYDAMLTAFAAYVRGDRVNPNGYDYELALYRTVLACCGE